MSKFNEKKAVFAGYNIWVDDDSFFSDVDGKLNILGKDGKYRWVAFEVKHVNEKTENYAKQITDTREMLKDDIPIFVVMFCPTKENTKVVEGKITNSSGTVATTKTAWFDLTKMVIKYVDCLTNTNLKAFEGRKVEDLIKVFKLGENKFTENVHSKTESEWWSLVNSRREPVVVGEPIKEELKKFFEHPISKEAFLGKTEPTMAELMMMEVADYWNNPNDVRTKMEEQQRFTNWEW